MVSINLIKDLKTCSKCKLLLPITSFHKEATKRDGRRGDCKSCSILIRRPTRLQNKEKYKATQKLYYTSDQGKKGYHARTAKRRASKKQATPKWADLTVIKQFYLNCPKGYHVDHIIPLNHPLVQGLHVIENLQYLTAKENCSKNNSFKITVGYGSN